MQTGKQIAIFDCKQYNAKLPKEQWRVLGDDENVQCTITYALSDLPYMFKQALPPDIFKPGSQNSLQVDEFVRLYSSKTEKEDAARQGRAITNDRAAVRFKVGANCAWFDKYGRKTERPHNTELDGKRYEVNIDFARKAKQPGNSLAPSGYWANAIMYRKVEDNPFAGQEFEKDETPDDPQYIQHFDNDEANKPAAPAPAAAPAAPAPAPAPAAPAQSAPAQSAVVNDDGDLPF